MPAATSSFTHSSAVAAYLSGPVVSYVGGSSLASGEMELMVHRRTLHEDWRGVGEPSNETACGCINCGCPGMCELSPPACWEENTGK